MKKRILVLGGGLAGLSAAIHLTRSGYSVTLLEKRPFAGGRTYSFERDFWPQAIDNGPHVMLGSYEDMLVLLGIVGARDRFTFTGGMKIPYFFPGGQALLADKKRPAPFHLVAALMGFSPLNGRQKWRIARLFLQIGRTHENPALDHITAADWLVQHHQDDKLLALFWRPLILATLNEEPARVSMLQLFRVLKLGFLREREASQIIQISQGLSASAIQPCVDWLEVHGCQILFQHRINDIGANQKSGKVRVETNKGVLDEFDLIVSTLPFPQLLALMEDSQTAAAQNLSALRSFEGSAIVNLHFWYPDPLINAAMASLHDIHSQWLFAHGSHHGLTHHTLVISSADAILEQYGKANLSQMLLSELATVLPDYDPNRVQHHYMTVEKNATLVCGPGVEAKRPVPGALTNQIYVAGDWTRTGLPPTMESAVRSGRLVAEAIALNDPDYSS